MTPQKALSKIIDIVGTQTEVARLLGVTQTHVWNWLNRDKEVPARYAIELEEIVKGEVTRDQLSPSVFAGH